MNPKIEKLKAEKEKNLRRIDALNARNEEIDAKITELENTDIVGMVRENGITPEALAELIHSLKNNITHKEEEKHDE